MQRRFSYSPIKITLDFGGPAASRLCNDSTKPNSKSSYFNKIKNETVYEYIWIQKLIPNKFIWLLYGLLSQDLILSPYCIHFKTSCLYVWCNLTNRLSIVTVLLINCLKNICNYLILFCTYRNLTVAFILEI